MHRNALHLAACGLLVAVSGCSWFGQKPKAEVAGDPYAAGGAPYDQPAAKDLGYQPAAGNYEPAAPMGGARYHTVQKKDTLYSLARQYYGDAKKWRDIYEANRAELGDPNRIKVGQRLAIP